jgi:hypothetical protein
VPVSGSGGRGRGGRYGPDRGGGWRALVLALLVVGLIVGAYFLGHGVGGGTRTVTTPWASASSDTVQGAVLAAATFASKNLTDQWSTSLGYRVVSFTPSAATVETIVRVRPRVKGRHTIWLAWNIHLAYQGGQWLQVGQLHPPTNPPPLWTSPPAILQEFKPWPRA